jgi:hypothetical protein
MRRKRRRRRRKKKEEEKTEEEEKKAEEEEKGLLTLGFRNENKLYIAEQTEENCVISMSAVCYHDKRGWNSLLSKDEKGGCLLVPLP